MLVPLLTAATSGPAKALSASDLLVDGVFFAPTSGKTWDVNFTGAQETPRAYQLVTSIATADLDVSTANLVDDGAICVGQGDGTVEGFVFNYSEDTADPTNCQTISATAGSIALFDSAGEPLVFMKFNSFLADSGSGGGIRFDVADKVLTFSVPGGSSGMGYTIGDVLTEASGKAIDSGGRAATFTVATVGGSGEVTSVTLTSPGIYFQGVTNPVNTTGGTGTGAQINIDSFDQILTSAYAVAIGAYIGGSHECVVHTTSSTIGGTATETLSITPQCATILGSRYSFPSTAVNLSAHISVGFACINPTDTQVAFTRNSDDNVGTTRCQCLPLDDKVYSDVTQTGTGQSVEMTLGTNQFTTTLRGVTGSRDILVLCSTFAADGGLAWAGMIDRLASGVTSYTDPGFKPLGVRQVLGGGRGIGVKQTGGAAATIAVSMFDADTENTIGFVDEDNRAAADSASYWASNATKVTFLSPASVVYDYNFDAFTGSGWDVVNVTTNTVVRNWPCLVIGREWLEEAPDELGINDDAELVVFNPALAEAPDELGVNDTAELVTFSPALAEAPDTIGIESEAHLVVFGSQVGVQGRMQAARSGMEAGQAGRSGGRGQAAKSS